jgi:two-component system, NarL family, nitrate/nitrite response regulator NarL
LALIDAAAGSAPAQVRVLIAHSRYVVREMLNLRLNAEPGIAVVATARDGPTARRLIAAREPDVVLLDEALPGLDGGETARQIRGACPAAAVVVLTGAGDPALEQALWEADVCGYMFTARPGAELLAAIRAAVHVHRHEAAALA